MNFITKWSAFIDQWVDNDYLIKLLACGKPNLCIFILTTCMMREIKRHLEYQAISRISIIQPMGISHRIKTDLLGYGLC